MKLLRRGLFAIIGLIVLVEGAVILADFQDRHLFASLAKALGVFVSGNTCNIAIGAKLLFWLQLAVELGIVALTLVMKPTVLELEQASRMWDFRSIKGLPKTPLMFLLFVAFAVLCYYLSYAIGYSQSTRHPRCSTVTFGQVRDYWVFLAIFAARGIAVVAFCGLYFDYKATKAS